MGELDPLAGKETLVRKMLNDEKPKKFEDWAIFLMEIAWLAGCFLIWWGGIWIYKKIEAKYQKPKEND